MLNAQLQIRTSYSLLASTNRIPAVVSLAKEYGYSYLGISDLNTMHGVVEFYQVCLSEGIRPVIGVTIQYQTVEGDRYSVMLLAKNLQGYKDLMKISTLKMSETIESPFLFQQLKEHLGNVKVIFPSENGEIEALFSKDADAARHRLNEWSQNIDRKDILAGISIQNSIINQPLEWFSFLRTEKIALLSLHDTRYLFPGEEFTLQVLQHIQEGTTIDQNTVEKQGNYYLPKPKEITARFLDMQLGSAIEKANQVAEECQFEIPLHQKLLPQYPVPENQTAESYLRTLCMEALPLRVEQPNKIYWDRLEMELTVIHEMGFDDYFLIVWDVMDFAHQQQIVTGAGRGSAAGSLVSYILSITDVDPIQFNLLFERFLNRERYTMPDIDLDIPDNRREEVLNYVGNKYGTNHVAQIATFGTMAAKMALRDVCRVFGLSQSEANQWANAVPNTLKISLGEAKKNSVKLQNLITLSSENQLLFETAEKIEGLPRHISTHAAGVVISDRKLTHYVPLQKGSGQIPLTQFTMGDVETVGLLKMDFLGLRNLSIMDDTLQSIRKIYKKDIVLNQIPLNDSATLELFQKGQTTGVFQFESAGIRNVLRKLGPTSIEDIAAVNALYRPGPMENIDLFVQRKKGKIPIEYPHQSLASILAITYGVMVYQEQVMQVASKMAGFSLGQADILRRAISKKKKEVLDEERNHFISGAEKQGYSKENANQVYDYIERFANYGFNRSHAVAYSFIGYQMAYLKVHYPAPFFAALLHSVRHNATKVKEYVAEAKRYQIKVNPPDINQSEYSFYLKKDEILFGFSSLKGIRRDFIFSILKERRENGAYTSLDNFLIRTERKWLKVDTIIPLIFIGAFDSLDSNRKKLVTELDGRIKNIEFSGGSMDLLEIFNLNEEEISDYSLEEKLAKEAEYLGLYLSGHPVEEYQSLRIAKQAINLNEVEVGKKVRCLVYGKEIRTIRTKKGESMAFIEGDDLTGSISITVFPRIYRTLNGNIPPQTVYYVEGKVERSTYNQELQILAEYIVPAENIAKEVERKTCYLKITEQLETPEINNQIYAAIQNYHGNIPVILFYVKSNKKLALPPQDWIQDIPEARNTLLSILGEGNVVFQ